jgi:Fe-S oxidoreductase
MCPSYRATRDERHSTRGRAKMLVEMFTGEVTQTSWRNQDVHDALELCLSCKGCAVDCPTGVDMASYKAEFNSHYYARRIRPRVMYALGLLPWLSRVATRVPRAASGALRVGGVGRLLRRAAGVTTDRPTPSFARKPFRRTQTARHLRQPDSATVVLWPDTFTNAFDPALGEDTAAVLAAAGETVHIPAEWACCGRTLYDPGMLDLARHSLRRVLQVLDPFLSRGIPVVVPEPSCLAAFRDELPALLPDDPRAAELARLARSLSEHLIASGGLDRLAAAGDGAGRIADGPGAAGTPVVIHPHCHGRAASGTRPDEKVLGTLGYRPSTLDAGCCGLAGSFGYAAETAPVSRTIATEHWLPRLSEAVDSAGAGGAGAILAMDGFSCITQLDQLDGRAHQTVAALIRQALARGPG